MVEFPVLPFKGVAPLQEYVYGAVPPEAAAVQVTFTFWSTGDGEPEQDCTLRGVGLGLPQIGTETGLGEAVTTEEISELLRALTEYTWFTPPASPEIVLD